MKQKLKDQREEIDRLNSKLSTCYTDKIQLEQQLVKASKAITPIEKIEKESEPITSSPLQSISSSDKDRLTKIEGIGPKIEEILNAAGINTYQNLIDSPISKLKEVLINQGPTYAVHDPSTWGEQAQLAKNEEWDNLLKLQAELKGGKRKS